MKKFIKPKYSCSSNNTDEKMNMQTSNWEKILLESISYTRLISKIYRKFLQFSNNVNNPFKNKQKNLDIAQRKNMYKWPKNTKCSMSLVMREM